MFLYSEKRILIQRRIIFARRRCGMREEFDCALDCGDLSYDYCRVRFDTPTGDGWITLFESRCICPGQGQSGSFRLKVSSLKVAQENQQWCLKGETYNGDALTLTPKNQTGSGQSLKNLVLGCQRKSSDAITVGLLNSKDRLKETAETLLDLREVPRNGEQGYEHSVQEIIASMRDTEPHPSRSINSQPQSQRSISTTLPALATNSQSETLLLTIPSQGDRSSLCGTKRRTDPEISGAASAPKRAGFSGGFSTRRRAPQQLCTAPRSEQSTKSCRGRLQVHGKEWLCVNCHATGRMYETDGGDRKSVV